MGGPVEVARPEPVPEPRIVTAGTELEQALAAWLRYSAALTENSRRCWGWWALCTIRNRKAPVIEPPETVSEGTQMEEDLESGNFDSIAGIDLATRWQWKDA